MAAKIATTANTAVSSIRLNAYQRWSRLILNQDYVGVIMFASVHGVTVDAEPIINQVDVSNLAPNLKPSVVVE